MTYGAKRAVQDVILPVDRPDQKPLCEHEEPRASPTGLDAVPLVMTDCATQPMLALAAETAANGAGPEQETLVSLDKTITRWTKKIRDKPKYSQ